MDKSCIIFKMKLAKNWARILIILLILFITFWTIINRLDFTDKSKQIELGVTFSHKYASQSLGLDWTQVYWAIINDLGVKKLRLIAHWDEIEAGDEEYNFNDLDWMLGEAQKKDIQVILAIGRRTPRWPECHDPLWIKNLDKQKQDQKLLEMIEKTVLHFKKYDNIWAWQVENEPFLKVFGECPEPDYELLVREVNLVKSLDKRPVIVTDSGELSNWKQAASLADIFGATMYKTVWNKFLGAWRYPLPPAFYYLKSKRINNEYNLDKIIVSELQAEPWFPGGKDIKEISLYDQFNSFSLDDFENNLKYVKRAGFTESYLWGVEWWYWLKTVKNRGEFWQQAQGIWQN
ncbi:MAG: hypothetical protein ABIJ91_01960 [Candidatus Kuenenbacteria bacterium]